MISNCKKLRENPKYANLGKPWKEEELVKLLSCVHKKMTHEDIANEHQRSINSISLKLKSIAADYYEEKRSIADIMKYTGLSHEDIADAISKREYQNDMAKKKKDTKNSVTSIDPVKDPQSQGITKDDFYHTIKELLVVAKDIQRMMKDFHADTFVTPSK